jgi:hypothetical protein
MEGREDLGFLNGDKRTRQSLQLHKSNVVVTGKNDAGVAFDPGN